MTALPQAEMPSMVALGSIWHLGALLEVVSETESPAMVIYTHAILVLENLWHHVGSDTFALPFGFLGIIGLPFVPLLVFPFIILSPLFDLPFILGNLNRFRQRGPDERQSQGCEELLVRLHQGDVVLWRHV